MATTDAATDCRPTAGTELFPEHLADLRASGLSDDTIATMNVHSLSAAGLAKELGYNPRGVRSALVIPYPSLDFARYKLFPPASGSNGHGSMRYAQAKGSGVHLYVLPSVRTAFADARAAFHYVEGEKKAAKGTQEGLPCLGLGGLWNWLQAGTADGIPELDAIVHVNRDELIVPDSDAWTRPDLQQAVYAFGRELEARGAKVNVVIIPAPEGRKVGLDDFLVAHGAEAFSKLERVGLKHAAFTKQREWYPSWKESRAGKVEDDCGQGRSLLLSDPDPWPHAVDGADLLDELAAVHRRYVVLPAGSADAAALWDVHTYLIDALHVSPIQGVTSPQKRCGKSTHLDVCGALVRRPVSASNITAAALFRVVEMRTPTLLIDEADTFLAEREELRGILNAGHTRSTAQVVRTVGDDHEPRVFGTFCAKAIAAIGELPGTIEDRAIILRMKRRAPSEHVDRLRRDRIDHELEPLRRKAARWAADNAAAVREADPDVPMSLNDRAADNWRPLLAIADSAGGTWPARARKAAELLSGAGASEDSDVRVQLLMDVRELFDERRGDRLPSELIVERLVQLENRPWAEWRRGKPLTATGLARLLKPFGIRSKQVWLNGGNVHGYERADFADAWARYLPAADNAVKALETLEPASDKAETPFSHPLEATTPSGSKNGENPCATTGLAGLAFRQHVTHRDSCDEERCDGCAEVLEL